MKRTQSPEQRARQRVQQSQWRRRNAAVLNFKLRNSYATDAEYCERRKRVSRDFKRSGVQLKEAA